LHSDFLMKLDHVFGQRQIFHVMECSICGYDEFYFQHPETKAQIGLACEGCNYIFRFEEHFQTG